MFNSVGTVGVAFKSGRMWMNILFVGGTCGIIDFFIICVEHIFFPSLTKKLELLVNQGVNLDRNNTKDMPKIVREKLAYYNEFQSNNELDKITERISEIIQKKYFKSKLDTDRKLTREEIIQLSKLKEEYNIPFKDLVKILHEFQVKQREKLKEQN